MVILDKKFLNFVNLVKKYREYKIVTHNLNNKIFSPLNITVLIIGLLIIFLYKFNLYNLLEMQLDKIFPKHIEKILTDAFKKENIKYDSKNALKYSFKNNQDYSSILKFNDKYRTVYVFIVETDVIINNQKPKIDYEIGRIYLNNSDKDKSTCTYNYGIKIYNRKVNYFTCSETQFLKNLPKISKMKRIAFEQLENTTNLYNRLKYCEGLKNYQNNDGCSDLINDNFSETTYSRLNKIREYQLENLFNTAI